MFVMHKQQVKLLMQLALLQQLLLHCCCGLEKVRAVAIGSSSSSIEKHISERLLRVRGSPIKSLQGRQQECCCLLLAAERQQQLQQPDRLPLQSGAAAREQQSRCSGKCI